MIERMQKVIGLDIGSYSIKAVEIINSFKSYQIKNFYELEMPIRDDIDRNVLLAQSLEQLFKDNNLQADRILTAMPGQYISSRIVPVSFSDPRKISMAVMSDVEDAVPFNLEDMIVDNQILGTAADGRTIVMVVMTRKSFLRSFLDHLHHVNIDPKLIDVDSLSFYNLAPYLRLEPNECAAMVDVGHEKTSVCIVQSGLLKMFRSINIGGAYLTEFLSRDLECSIAEAQVVKHRVSRLICDGDPGVGMNPDDKQIAERMTLACNAIVKDLGRTLYAFKTWDKTKISRIFLSGGSAQIKNLDMYLSEQLGVPVYLNRLEATDLKIDESLADKTLVMPQSIAIGMRSVVSTKRYSQINLRKGEFAYVQNYAQIMRAAKIAAQVLGVAVLLLILSYGVRSFIYNRQIADLEREYQKEYSGIGITRKKNQGKIDFSRFRNEVRSSIQKEVTSKRDAVDSFIAASGTSPGLLMLQDISAALPKTVKIDVTQYLFTGISGQPGGRLTLKAETDGYSSVEAIKEALKKVPSISDLEEKQSGGKPGTDNKVIEFTLQMSFKAGPSSGKS
jgi:type IV pilus assembly protein PilM